MSDELDDWSDFEGTCPDGFCRHWSCNGECEKHCAQCGERCPDHDDTSHEFVEPDPAERTDAGGEV